MSGGRRQGYTVVQDCEDLPWTHLVIQAATINGLGGNVQWDHQPWARVGGQNQVRDQLSPNWEISPFRAVDRRMNSPLVLTVPEGCVRNVVAE
eukprot:14717139-Alexandrium_andersonii.AAC.1